MPFIGVIANEKNEKFIKKEIVEKMNLREDNIIFIKEKNIDNIKNIKFETIILIRKLKNMEILNKILANVKYFIVNTDRIRNIEMFEKLDIHIITFGFNSNAIITATSVTEEESLICVGKEIKTKKNRIIEPQEIKINTGNNMETVMAIIATLLVYDINNKQN